ncbi:hypothetical protein QFC22_006678 [Naganishia vaughanmartiniae]|uniref:Uncharacterized protein n=1 Tax=Naganishia vaughanmartiniae TaxID=1424756 RepID=A0ACC2WID9_9TREE|nr:hypothetical protein QFC22_006678 [Naganishia vaughanmartiniae]
MSSVAPQTDAKPIDEASSCLPTGIRPYQEKDLKTVRMMIGTSVMEGLARANKQIPLTHFPFLLARLEAYFHPLIITFYVVLSLGLDYYSGWMPRDDIWWSPIALLTGFGAAALPLLGIVEFINRDYFETLLRLRLGAKDLLSIPEYYGDNLSVLEFRGEVIGLIAVDYQRPGENLESVIPGVKKEKINGRLNLDWLMGAGKKGEMQSVQQVVASTGSSSATSGTTGGKVSTSLKNRKSEKSTTTATVPDDSSVSSSSPTKANHLKGTTAHIRHLYVDAQYRDKGLEEELVQHALTHAFSNPAIQRAIIASPSYASSSLLNLLKQMPFIHVASGDDAVVPGMPGHEERQGIMVKDTREFEVVGWKVVQWSGQWWEITRQQWDAWMAGQGK